MAGYKDYSADLHVRQPWNRLDIWDDYLVKNTPSQRVRNLGRWAVVRIADGKTVFISKNRLTAEAHMRANCRKHKYTLMEYFGGEPDGAIGCGF